jgi:hypothetical protein
MILTKVQFIPIVGFASSNKPQEAFISHPSIVNPLNSSSGCESNPRITPMSVIARAPLFDVSMLADGCRSKELLPMA